MNTSLFVISPLRSALRPNINKETSINQCACMWGGVVVGGGGTRRCFLSSFLMRILTNSSWKFLYEFYVNRSHKHICKSSFLTTWLHFLSFYYVLSTYVLHLVLQKWSLQVFQAFIFYHFLLKIIIIIIKWCIEGSTMSERYASVEPWDAFVNLDYLQKKPLRTKDCHV